MGLLLLLLLLMVVPQPGATVMLLVEASGVTVKDKMHGVTSEK
jgi:hypothetical protein